MPTVILPLAAGGFPSAVYQSTDGGIVWEKLALDIPAVNFLSFAPAAPHLLYAATDAGLYEIDVKTTPVTVREIPVNGYDSPPFRKVLVDQAGTIYATFKGESFWRKVAGNPWRQLGSYSDRTLDFTIDPARGDLLWTLRSTGVFQLTGGKWVNRYPFPDFRNQGIVMYVPDSGSLYAATRFEFVRTEDGGDSWRGLEDNFIAVSGPDNEVADLQTSSDAGGAILAAKESGVFKSTDGGLNWKRVLFEKSNAISVDPNSPDTLYSAGYRVWKSTDAGESWSPITEQRVSIDDVAVVSGAMPALVIATWVPPINVQILKSFGEHAIQRSTDGGATWTKTVFETYAPYSSGRPRKAEIQISSAAPGRVYARIARALWRSDDAGATWTQLIPADDFEVSQTGPETVFVTRGEEFLKSTDAGVSWNPTGNLNSRVWGVTADPVNAGHVVALSSAGLHESTDSGATWLLITGDLPVSANLAFGSQADTLFAYGSGLETLQIARSLFFPRLAADGEMFTGLAAANRGSQSCLLAFKGLDPSGRLVGGAGITNPAIYSLGPAEQVARLGTEIFGAGLPAGFEGWIRTDGASDVAGFFSIGSTNLDRLDGADASRTASTAFLLPEIQDGGWTRLYIANPEDRPATVLLELTSPEGARRDLATREILPNGVLISELRELFPAVSVGPGDYVRGNSNLAVLPFEYFGKDAAFVQCLNGLSIQAPSTPPPTRLWAPQYAVGGKDYLSVLTLINRDNVAGTVTLRFFLESGEQVGTEHTVELPPLGKVLITDQDFFGAQFTEQTTGYVLVESGGLHFAGSIVFSDQSRNRYSSALPLVGRLRNDLVISHLASSDSFFTGIAMLNPEETEVQVEMEVFDKGGTRLATKVETLGKGQRKSRLLTEYLPELSGYMISSGYVRLRSTQPIACFALYAPWSMSSLAAIPAQ